MKVHFKIVTKPRPLLNSSTERQIVLFENLLRHLAVVFFGHVGFYHISVTESCIITTRTPVQHLQNVKYLFQEVEW